MQNWTFKKCFLSKKWLFCSTLETSENVLSDISIDKYPGNIFNSALCNHGISYVLEVF